MSGAATTLDTGGLDRVYDGIEALLPGVLHPVVQMVVWDTIEDFCFRTQYWRQSVAWTLPIGVSSTSLDLPNDTVSVSAVLEVHGLPTYQILPPSTLFDPSPPLTLRSGSALVACQPDRLAVGSVPGFLINSWSEGLRMGALARLYAQPSKPYSSPDLAGAYLKQYDEWVDTARLQASFASPQSGLQRIYAAIEGTLPGVMRPEVLTAVWDTVEDFCFRSTYWRQSVAWTLAAGATQVDLSPASPQARVAALVEVHGLRNYRFLPPSTIMDLGSPLAARTGTATVACKPHSLSPEHLPAFIVDTWSEALRVGAMARLCGYAAKSYSAPELADKYSVRYDGLILQARAQASYASPAGGLDRIYNSVEAVLPGIARAQVDLALWNAVEEFCFRSGCWRETIAWTMDPAVSVALLDTGSPKVRVAAVLGVHGLRAYRILQPSTVFDTGDTSLARSGRALISCKPDRLAPDCMPTSLLDAWSEGLLAGTLYRLYLQPGMPWFQSSVGELHGKKFRSEIWLARDTARRAGDYPGPSFPYFARGRQLGGSGQTGFDALTPLNPGDYPPPEPVIVAPDFPLPDVLLPQPIDPDDLGFPTVGISDGVISDGVVAAAGVASLDFTDLAFADTQIGATARLKTVTLTNTGAAALNVSAIAATGFFTVTGASPPFTLAPAASVALTVAFAPTTTGTRMDTLTITSDAASSPDVVTLHGTGLSANGPMIALSVPTLTFTALPSGSISGIKTITVTNVGSDPLVISNVTSSGDFLVVDVASP